MYEEPSIPAAHLRRCLQEAYGLEVVSLEFLPLGLDNRAGVYRVLSEEGSPYLLKARSGAFYEASCYVPRYLKDQGIEAIVAPLRTRSDALWTHLGEWTLTVYPFHDGDTRWTPGLTDAQWRAVGTALGQIHQVRPPGAGFQSLRRETFDPTGYRRLMDTLESQHIGAAGGSPAEQALRACWLAHRPTIQRGMAALETLAAVLQKQSGPYVICHADFHPGNIIRGPSGQVYVIDWDDVMLAPRERDFLFVGEDRADDAARQDTAAFFQGYGQTEVDWTALTYYLWERAITDVLVDAEAVFLRDDLGAASKAGAAATFQMVLTGTNIEKALAAAAHLPANLRT